MSSIHMFQHAQNLLINGGDFSQNYYNGGKDMGLNNLKQYVATDAMFDAAERFPPPKCHPGTREKVIKAIMDWINDADASEQAMWLYGPAGAGKSAIAQSVAILLQEILQDSKYAASFFFAKDAPRRGDGNKLFPTIAYQLAINFPSFRPHLDVAMINNPTLPTKSIDIQLRELIIEPLKHVENWPAHHPTVIIDGLDECTGAKRTQSALLSSLYKAITEHHIPLRFLIVSRPEYWIADYFQVGAFSQAARQISLHHDTSADAGIRKYLRDEFRRIYEENLPLMPSVPLPWPPEHLIKRFVHNASGQFVYASTVIKFVGESSDFCNPQEQLCILAMPGPFNAAAFSDLDRLYATILSAYPRLESMQCVLGSIMCNLHENIIQEFFGVPLGEIRLVLRAIRSLIHIKEHNYPDMYRVLEPIYGPPLLSFDNGISFCHLSFKEFIQDQSRSGCYSVDTYCIRAKVCYTMLGQGRKMLQSCLGDKVCKIDDSISRIGISVYRRNLHMLYGILAETCHLPYVMQALEDIDNSLRTVLTQQPFRLVQTSHILWFAQYLTYWLRDIPLNRKPFSFHQKLFKSLLYNLDVVMSISTKQLLDETPMYMPVFSYLAVHSVWRLGHDIHDVEADIGITYDDIMLELQHLQGLVYVSFEENARIIASGRVFRDDLYNHIQDAQQFAVWDNIRWRHVTTAIDRIMGIHWSLHDSHKDWYPQREHNDIQAYMECEKLSDINSTDCFQDDRRRAILDMITHPHFPAIANHEGLEYFVMAALSWLNRQMTGPHKVLIAEYDSTLLETMQSAAKSIFLNAYLEHFTNDYSSNLVMTHENPVLSIQITISNRPPNGTPSIIEERHPYCDRFSTDDFYHYRVGPSTLFRHVQRFHDTMMTSKTSGIISPENWYPHLAAFLLNMLVRCQYGTLNPGFEFVWAKGPREVFGLLLKCMPYAIPVEQNLNTMRALHYLCPQVDRKRRWRPPFGFCSLAIDFLKKYDELTLSPSEFSRFKTWLDELKTDESKRIVVDAESKVLHAPDDYTTDEDD